MYAHWYPMLELPWMKPSIYARNLAQRVGQELNIPVYCYGNAAINPTRRNLATIRSGEYEGLAEKLRDPQWAPDFGPADSIPKPARP